jgi:L-asparagine transporter-like permease
VTGMNRKSLKKRVIMFVYILLTVGLIIYSFYLQAVSGLSLLASILMISAFYGSTSGVMTILYYWKKNESNQGTIESEKLRADFRKFMLWCGLLFLLCIAGVLGAKYLKGPIV